MKLQKAFDRMRDAAKKALEARRGGAPLPCSCGKPVPKIRVQHIHMTAGSEHAFEIDGHYYVSYIHAYCGECGVAHTYLADVLIGRDRLAKLLRD